MYVGRMGQDVESMKVVRIMEDKLEKYVELWTCGGRLHSLGSCCAEEEVPVEGKAVPITLRNGVAPSPCSIGR